MTAEILTIGHSTQSAEQFLERLSRNAVTAVADVRSVPHSRRNPQFNRERLACVLQDSGIRYVFLGKELGARSSDESCYLDDKVQYARLAQTELFRSGLERVLAGAATYRVALLCAEKEPLECHRTILVARELIRYRASVQHILIDGSLEPHADTLERLLKELKLKDDGDLFRSREQLIEEAYDLKAGRIAYDRGAHRK
jgi:uncharacterized protein (DUF488 family)